MNLRLIALISVVAALALYRILPHPANFTPVMAMALFAGARFDDTRTAFLAPLLAMLLSDLVLGLHETLPFVYAGMALAVVSGLCIRGRGGFFPVVAAAATGSIGFFVISNFGAWLYSPELYGRDWSGLAAAYVAAIPFYQNSLMSDVLFTILLFGGWALAERGFPRLLNSASVDHGV